MIDWYVLRCLKGSNRCWTFVELSRVAPGRAEREIQWENRQKSQKTARHILVRRLIPIRRARTRQRRTRSLQRRTRDKTMKQVDSALLCSIWKLQLSTHLRRWMPLWHSIGFVALAYLPVDALLTLTTGSIAAMPFHCGTSCSKSQAERKETQNQ